MGINARRAKRFKKSVTSRLQKIRDGLPVVAKMVGEATYEEIKADTPVSTGRLRAGWKITIETTANATTVHITNAVPYALEVEWDANGGMVRRNTYGILMQNRLQRAIKQVLG